jgi:outer membrane lipoprotein-sorting protein
MRFTLALLATAAALASTPAFADACVDEIKAAMGKAMTSGPMRMESTISGATQMTMKGEIVPPGNMRATVNTAGQVIEMVILDKQAWMNTAGVWTELPAEAAAQMAAGFDMANTGMLDAMTDAQCLGTTNVDGKDLKSYSWNLAVEGSTTVNRALVDPANNAPVRMETDVTAAGTVTNVVVDYVYDPSVTITAPAM